MKLHELKPPAGARRERRRVGRGLGSGRGKTSGKGVKGQKARAGGGVPPYFEGGQLPLVRKLPYRRGFNNPSRVEFEVVNLDQLEALSDTSEVTPEGLRAAGLIGKGRAPVKVLARGALTKKLTVHAHKFSAAARDAIRAAGGLAVQIGGAPAEVEAQTTKPEPPAASSAAEAPAADTSPPEAEAPVAEVARPARRRRAAAPAEAAPESETPAAQTDESAVEDKNA